MGILVRQSQVPGKNTELTKEIILKADNNILFHIVFIVIPKTMFY